MTIPEIRDRLYELADIHRIPELRLLAEETKRRSNGRKRAPKRQAPPTEGQILAIKVWAATYPDMSEWDIGRHFGLNQGRISEALHGKRI